MTPEDEDVGQAEEERDRTDPLHQRGIILVKVHVVYSA